MKMQRYAIVKSDSKGSGKWLFPNGGRNNLNEQAKCDFLRKRMIELREANGKSQVEMADIIYCNKSTLSRAEKIGGDTGYKTVRSFAEKYWKALYDPDRLIEKTGTLDEDTQLKKKMLLLKKWTIKKHQKQLK